MGMFTFGLGKKLNMPDDVASADLPLKNASAAEQVPPTPVHVHVHVPVPLPEPSSSPVPAVHPQAPGIGNEQSHAHGDRPPHSLPALLFQIVLQHVSPREMVLFCMRVYKSLGR